MPSAKALSSALPTGLQAFVACDAWLYHGCNGPYTGRRSPLLHARVALSGGEWCLCGGIGLLTWGTVELFIVDKTIRPKLVGGPIKLPFLPTFFGLVGGVKTMGFLGLFIGPVLMALLVAIWREWIREIELSNAPQIEIPPEITKERRSA